MDQDEPTLIQRIMSDYMDQHLKEDKSLNINALSRKKYIHFLKDQMKEVESPIYVDIVHRSSKDDTFVKIKDE
jgi:hypothetical protein